MKNTKTIIVLLFLFQIIFLAASCKDDGGNKNESVSHITGKDGWVFPDGNEYYSYTSDRKNEYENDSGSLPDMYRMLARRKTSLQNSGAALILAVVPMPQSVYGEYLPESFPNNGENTRRELISEYIAQNNEASVIYLDLTQNFIDLKNEEKAVFAKEGTLQEDAVYKIYSEIIESIPADVSGGAKALSMDTADISSRYTNAASKDYQATFMSAEYRTELRSSPSVLVQCGNADLTDELKNYISATFGSVGYITDYVYSESVMNKYSPDVVIQIIPEDMLYTLFDKTIGDSYSAAIRAGDDPYTTMTPVYLDSSMTNKDVVCIMGSVEEGSVIKVSGENFETFEAYPQDTTFFIDITIPKNGSETVVLTAKTEGKAESSPIEIYCEYSDKAGKRDVFAGKYSQLHYPYTIEDYQGTNLFREAELRGLAKMAESRLDRVRGFSEKDTKLIYLIAPNALTIYPETATDEMAAKKVTEESKLSQFVNVIKKLDNENIMVIDLPEYIRSKKDLGKLYYQTDTHWNTFGAYFGYYKLMETVHGDWGGGGTVPLELDNFDVYKKVSGCGDLYNFLGAGNPRVTENVTYCVPKNNLIATAASDKFGSDIRRTGNTELPNAVVTRDSFGGAMISYVSEHFNEIVWMSPGQLFLKEVIAANKPDYFIQVLVERNLSALLGG